MIRENGFSPLGIPQQRGFIYTIAVIDRGGDDGRLVIDARDGPHRPLHAGLRIGAQFDDAARATYGPPARCRRSTTCGGRAAAAGLDPAGRQPQRAGAEAEPARRRKPAPAAAVAAKPAASRPTDAAAAATAAAMQAKPPSRRRPLPHTAGNRPRSRRRSDARPRGPDPADAGNAERAQGLE